MRRKAKVLKCSKESYQKVLSDFDVKGLSAMVAEKDTFSFCVSGIAFGFALWIRAFLLSHSDSLVG